MWPTRPYIEGCVVNWALTHWGGVTHICIIGSDNGLSPGRRQAIIWINAGILSIGSLGTNVSEISIAIHTFFVQENVFENVVCKMAAIMARPHCVNTWKTEQNGCHFADDIFACILLKENFIWTQGNQTVLSKEWQCSSSIADYILVINNFIAY